MEQRRGLAQARTGGTSTRSRGIIVFLRSLERKEWSCAVYKDAIAEIGLVIMATFILFEELGRIETSEYMQRQTSFDVCWFRFHDSVGFFRK